MKAKYWIFSHRRLAAIIAGFCLAKGGEAASPVPYVMLGPGGRRRGAWRGFPAAPILGQGLCGS